MIPKSCFHELNTALQKEGAARGEQASPVSCAAPMAARMVQEEQRRRWRRSMPINFRTGHGNFSESSHGARLKSGKSGKIEALAKLKPMLPELDTFKTLLTYTRK